MDYNIGDIVRTKKQHPCGSKLWEITRVGVDFMDEEKTNELFYNLIDKTREKAKALGK